MALSQQVFKKSNIRGMNLDGIMALSNEIVTSLAILKGWYFENRTDTVRPDLAEKFYREALEGAEKYGQQKLLNEIRPKLASFLIRQKRNTESLSILDSAYLLAFSSGDFDNALNICKIALGISDSRFSSGLLYKWMAQKSICADSLLKKENSEEQLSRKIALLSVQTEQSIKLLKLIRQKNEATIHAQTQGIVFLIVLTILVIIFLCTVILQRTRLHKAYLSLVKNTINALDNHQETTRVCAVSGFSSPFPQLKQALDKLIQESHVYLDPEISLGKLAQLLNTNEKYLSQLINQQYKVTFTELINELRIKKACIILSNQASRTKSIDQIADESGFQSKSTFYVAFKKVTGVTPLFFQKNAHLTETQSD